MRITEWKDLYSNAKWVDEIIEKVNTNKRKRTRWNKKTYRSSHQHTQTNERKPRENEMK